MNTDFLIIGGGIIGVCVASELRRRHPDCTVTLIEKEPQLGTHASGLNSGVLHAGFYYTADSLKARFCRDGNAEMTAFCLERGLPINRCGKLVVAKNQREVAGLDELLKRGRANGVDVELISAAEAREIEPRVKTIEKALWSPTTATVDPVAVMRELSAESERLGVKLLTGTRYLGREAGAVSTSAGRIDTGYVVGAAGLYADRIARDFGFARQLRMLPFKGLYLLSTEPPGAMRTNIYPVPDLRFPFLGIHLTVTVDNHLKIGPTAIPAFWREHYGGLGQFKLDELWETLTCEAGLMLRAAFDFRGLALYEMRRYWRPRLVAEAAELAEGVRLADYPNWRRPGIRAQLVDMEKRSLVMDWLLDGDEKSLHVLSAVSPAFTSALPFSRFVCDAVDQKSARQAAAANSGVVAAS